MKIRLSQTYKRFIVLFLSFAALVSILFLPIYVHTFQITKERILEQTQHGVESGVMNLNAMGNTVASTYLSFIDNADFRGMLTANGSYPEPPITLKEISESLNTPFVFFSAVHDVGVIYSELASVTRQRTFYSDAFYLYPAFLSCEDMNFDEWYRFIAETDPNGTWLPARRYHSTTYGSYTALTYAHKWNRVKNNTNTPVVYYALLDCDLMTDLLVDRGILDDGYLLVTDQWGKPLYASGEGREGGCTTLTAYSAANQLNIEVGVSNRYIFKQIQSLFLFYIGQLIFLIVGISALVIYFSRKGSQPMHLLIDSLKDMGVYDQNQEQLPGHRISSLDSDYTAISSSFMNMDQQLKESVGIINEQESQLRSYLFSKALTSGLYSPEDRERFGRLFSKFPESFRLVRIHADRTNLSESVDPFPAVLDAAGKEDVIPCFFHYIGYSSMIWVIEENASLQALEQIGLTAAEHIDSKFYFLVTHPLSSVEELPAAYHQLQFYSSASDASLGVTVINDNAFPVGRFLVPVSYPALHDIYDELCLGKDNRACAILEGMVDKLLSNFNDPSILRHAYTMIYDMMIQMKMEYAEKLGKVKLPLFDETKPEILFREGFPQCFHKIGALMRERTDQEDDTTRVMQFIRKNLFSSELCLTLICEQLQLQKPTVQNIMKSMTGTTFFSYVEEKRLEYACTLLRGKTPVQEVSASCGFTSPNSFYKAFKRKYGVSPSNFAENNGKDE